MVAEHEGMLAALWKLMFEIKTTDSDQLEAVLEYRKEVIWLMRNLIRESWSDKKSDEGLS